MYDSRGTGAGQNEGNMNARACSMYKQLAGTHTYFSTYIPTSASLAW